MTLPSFATTISLGCFNKTVRNNLGAKVNGFLLLSPTGSGKSWACKQDGYFRENAIDGDRLIDWDFDKNTVDWKIKDQEHLNIVLAHMQSTQKCICWYVGTETRVIEDAIKDGRLRSDQVLIVVLPESIHRMRVVERQKKDHDWARAMEHRNFCDSIAKDHGIPYFLSFEDAAEHIQNRREDRLANTPNHSQAHAENLLQ